MSFFMAVAGGSNLFTLKRIIIPKKEIFEKSIDNLIFYAIILYCTIIAFIIRGVLPFFKDTPVIMYKKVTKIKGFL